MTLRTVPELVARYTSELWTNTIGGPLGLHRDTIPKIYNGSSNAFVLPGVAYAVKYIDNSDPTFHPQSLQVLNDFLNSAPIGTMILQYLYMHAPHRVLIKYRYIWVKINDTQWQEEIKLETEQQGYSLPNQNTPI